VSFNKGLAVCKNDFGSIFGLVWQKFAFFGSGFGFAKNHHKRHFWFVFWFLLCKG